MNFLSVTIKPVFFLDLLVQNGRTNKALFVNDFVNPRTFTLLCYAQADSRLLCLSGCSEISAGRAAL